MALRISLKGNADLSTVHIPSSWIGENGITHSSKYNISIKSMEDIKRRLRQQRYWLKNENRETLVKFTFDDRWVQSEWFRNGNKDGREGIYWNPSKLDKLQEHLDKTLYVPDDFYPMKEIKKRFGSWATKQKVEEAGFEVLQGRKRGHCGSVGTFVTPRIMECTTTVSPADGVIPVRNIFSSFPHLSGEDIAMIAEDTTLQPHEKKMRDGCFVSRVDLMVTVNSLEKIKPKTMVSTKKLRSREVTTADVPGNSKALRKMLKNK